MPTPIIASSLRGPDGTTLDQAHWIADAAKADLVAFGELHGNAVGATHELQLLQGLHAAGRPVALAMEFFERDVQADLDRYLAGELEEEEFRKRTRQGKAYPSSHRPLIEYCKANGIPVIAANAPRPLVRGYRKSDAETYAAYLEGLTEAERGTLPRSTSTPDDAYKAKFMKFMGPKRGPSFFRSQALWDDAMGEAVADFRESNPEHQVLLVIGAFHVTGRLGTITKFAERRPDDRVHVTVMDFVENPAAPLTQDQKTAGDALLFVRPPQRPKP